MTSPVLLSALVLLGVAYTAPPASAEDYPPVDCENAQTQFDMNYCANEEYLAADKALNAAYKTVMGHMEATDKDLAAVSPTYAGAVEALKKAQRAWIAYRDGQCELSGFSARGGSMEPMLVSGCLADLTKKRTQELKDLLTAY
ncbi:lysozyme inhibitor LprI family protein [Pararhizobium sp.]|uniref:lysozyme inhibitor LprI family protein n=1 Tax=Pararhizobium sp. TaxID=1977563 RepID=UPI0027221682|nr:lysozyme inhibitor LprI family protein [Pararhizobium sp.]MDO9415013.1 lysozyme inhibitor LprI family protein [Pararhizobium sp.]